MGGISYLQYIRGLAAEVHDNWPQVLAQLEAIRAYAIHHAGALINLTGDENLLADVAPAAGRFMAGLPTGPRPAEPWNQTLPPESEAFLIPTQTGVKPASQPGHPPPASSVPHLQGCQPVPSCGAALQLQRDRLPARRHALLGHNLAVGQSGAYGAFLDYDLASGQLSYCSYRDPGLLSTLADFDKSAQFLAESETPQDTLTKSIVGTIGQIDAYMLPDAKGYTALYRHVLGISDEERQARRDRVLATSAEELRQLADLLQVAAEEGRVAAVTSKAAAAAAQAQQPGLFDRVEAVL